PRHQQRPAVLVAIGVWVLSGRVPVGTSDAGLAGLVRRAASARTVADLRALHELARAAYEKELARGDDCNLVKLVSLGTSTAVTGNPRLDRQAKDLRFVLARAVEAGRGEATAMPGFHLMSVADAAVTDLGLEKRRIVREKYAAARKLAGAGNYEDWHQHIQEMQALLQVPEGRMVSDALSLELLLVTYFERGMAYDVKLRLDHYLKSRPDVVGVGVNYFVSEVLPMAERDGMREKELQSALDFNVSVKKNGMWKWDTPKTAMDMYGEWYVLLSQLKVDNLEAVFCLKRPVFQEAVVTGQVRLLKMSDSLSGSDGVFGAGVFFLTRELVKWSVSDSTAQGERHYAENHQDMEKRWRWFRIHITYQGDGVWVKEHASWLEGRQPFGLRRAGYVLSAADRERAMSVGGDTTEGRPGIGLFGFKTNKSAVEWRGVGIEVIRPRM
ncbi:hypothetical protein ACFL01_02410, partial [Planctomycetota bacterium]